MQLGLDTSGKYLNIALMQGDVLVDQVHLMCFKHQSEMILPSINELLTKNNVSIDDISDLIVTLGPGSYTGIRIAMTAAKVWARMKNIRLYALDSLQLIAGRQECGVYLDARGNRGYFASFKDGQYVKEDQIITLPEFQQFAMENAVRGDLDVLGGNDDLSDINQHFLDLKEFWVPVSNIDTLVPRYLKDSSEYLK